MVFDNINLYRIGVASVNASNNHFPCDCRIASWIDSALFANQSRDRVMANNFCIAPYELNGKSIQVAADEARLFDNCPDADRSEENTTQQQSLPPDTGTDPSAAVVRSRANLISCYPLVTALLLAFICTV